MSEALDKIKKLLRLKNGGTQAEVETAMRMARDLADRHGIDLDAVDLTEEDLLTRLTHKAVPVTSKGSLDEFLAERIIKRFFRVSCVWEDYYDREKWSIAQRLNIIGTAVEVEIAEYVFEFLVGHFKRSWRRRPKRLRDRSGFIRGIFMGLCVKLIEGESTAPSKSTQLVLSRKAYIEKHWGETKTIERQKAKSSNGAAYRAGFHVGLDTNIRPGIKATPSCSGPALGYNPQLPLL